MAKWVVAKVGRGKSSSKHALATSRSWPEQVALPHPVSSSSSFPPLSPIPIPFLPLLPFLPSSLPFGFGDFLELIPSTETRSIWAPTFRLNFFRFFGGHWNQTLCPFWGCPRFSVPRRWPQAAGLGLQVFGACGLEGLFSEFQGFSGKKKRKKEKFNEMSVQNNIDLFWRGVGSDPKVGCTYLSSFSLSLFLSPFFFLSHCLSLSTHPHNKPRNRGWR